MKASRVMIERMVLADLGIAAERAERIRELVAHELTHALAREGWPRSRAPANIGALVAPTVELAGTAPDHTIALAVASGLARSLTGVGRPPSGGDSDAGV